MMFALPLALANLSLAPALQAIGWALLHLVWQGAAIAVALAILLAMLPSRSANLRYALSCAALALVVVVGVLTGLRSYAAGAPPALPLARHAMAPSLAVAAPGPGSDRAPASLSTAAIVVATLAPSLVASLPDPWRAASDALPVVVSLWIAGVTLLSLRLVVQWLHASRLARVDAQPACEPWLAMSRRLAAALGVRRAVRLLESTVVQVPAVVGLLRPVILLPANTLTGLLPGQLEMILAHELAHIRRHDFLVNLLQAAVETLLFYHPAVWWISHQVRTEREHCCDDLAVNVCGSPLQYARALTRLEELRAESLPFALSARGGSLPHRIRRVVGSPSATTVPVRGVTALALLFGLLLAFAGPSLTAFARPRAEVSAKPRTAESRAAGAAPTASKPAHVAAHDADQAQGASETAEAAASAATSLAQSVVEPDVAAVAASDADPDPQPAPDPDLQPAADPDPGPDPNSNAAIASGHLRLTVDELIQLRSQGVRTSDILEMRSLLPKVQICDIANMFAVGATPEYVRQMQAAGIDIRSAKEAQAMASVGVTPAFVSNMRRAGIAVESARVAIGLAAVGVTPEVIRGLRAAGLTIDSAEQAKSLVAVGVTPENIRGLRAAGLTIESAEQAKSLVAVGVTPDFVRDLRATGLKIASPDEAKSLAGVGVTADYVREMRAAGVAIRDAGDAKSLIGVGVTPEFVRRLARAGYRDLGISDLCRLGAAGVPGGFVEEMSQYRTR